MNKVRSTVRAKNYCYGVDYAPKFARKKYIKTRYR
uniref:Uncharacterized protein n=1 Tax=Arundo donax TaxID=35708 RepID=A0A0A9BN51_ARUDO